MFSPALDVSPTAVQVMLSGQVATRADGGVVDPADPAQQIRQVYDNLHAAICAAGGAGLTDLVRTTVYLVSAELIAIFYQVRAELYPVVFGERPRPASTLVVVSALVDPRYLVEIDGVAAIER